MRNRRKISQSYFKSPTKTFRAAHQIVLLHRTQVNPGLCAQSGDALLGELREGQPSVGAGDASVQV